MFYTKTKILKSLFPLTLRFLSRERTLVGPLLYTVLRCSSNLYMLILLIFIFFSKSAVSPKYCLLAIDLFTFKTYTYTMKCRHLLAQKMELFYRDIQLKRQQVAQNERMGLQVNLKFQQNEIKRLNKKIQCRNV